MIARILKRWVLASVLILAIEATAESPPIRIGIPIPLSGGLEAYGEAIRSGFVAAKEFLKADNTELIFEDDRCNATLSVTIAQKLLEIDKVNVVSGIYCNHALLPAAPLYNRAGIPVITTGSTTGDVKGIGKRIFRIFPADQLGVKPLLKVITKEHQKLCMFSVIDTYTELIQRTVNREFGALKPPFNLNSTSVMNTETDFRPALLRISKSGCDSLFLNTASDEEFVNAVKQIKKLGIRLPLYGLYNPGSGTVRQALGALQNGVIYADIISIDESASELGRQFLEFHRKKFGDFKVAQPVGLFAFEALRLILEANKNNQPLNEFLAGREIKDGAISPYRFDEDGASEGIPFKVLRVTDGAPVDVTLP